MRYERDILRFLKISMPGLRRIAWPRWVRASRWRPALCFANTDDGRILAIDISPSAVIPVTLYQEQVVKLLRSHPNLRAVVCVLEDGFEEHPQIEQQCKRLGMGLKVLAPGLGIQTIVPIDLDPHPETVALIAEPGWFPEAILRQTQDLSHLIFARVLEKFAKDVRKAGNDSRKTLRIVRDTIDTLLQQHPGVRANAGSFMRLSRFENLLRTNSPMETDHVFHSFRVFLAGCPVINQFYDQFSQAQRRFSGSTPSATCVEYAWLLTSLFHDVGRTKEKGKAEKVAGMSLENDNLVVEVRANPTRWTLEHWREAAKALGSLGAFVPDAKDQDVWDGATIGDAEGNRLGGIWTRLYDELKYHAVMSAFDLLAGLFDMETATEERRNRRFVVTHAVPAALSILLHDWRLWPQAKGWRLSPINGLVLPMAALLVYLDTWDDYKRKGPEPVIYVKDYAVTSRGVRVEVVWGDSAAYEAEKIKYAAFKKAVEPLPFPMEIRTNM